MGQGSWYSELGTVLLFYAIHDPKKNTQTLWIILVHVGRHMIFHICIYIIYTHVYYAEYTFPMFEVGTLTHPHLVYAFIRLKTNGCRCGAPGWCLKGHGIHTTTFWIHAGYIYHCWLHIPNCWFHITFYPSFFCPHCCNWDSFHIPIFRGQSFFQMLKLSWKLTWPLRPSPEPSTFRSWQVVIGPEIAESVKHRLDISEVSGLGLIINHKQPWSILQISETSQILMWSTQFS